MSKKAVVEESAEIKDVYLDFESAILIFEKRGIEKGLEKIAGEIGYTMQGMRKLRKKAPKAVAILHHFLKENCLKFEDLVKECDSKK